MRRKTEADYHALAAERGFDWLGDTLPANTNTPAKWRCAEGHIWDATFQSISSIGSGCPHCSGNAPKTESDYHSLAVERGFDWIGDTLPANTRIPTKWRCTEGHIWEATFQSISHQGSGCPYCSGNAPKTESDYHSLAAERGFKWLGDTLPVNTHTPTNWRCIEGHIWEATFNSISHQGTGCPHCSGNAPKTQSDYHSLAAERGFKWLGSEAINVSTKTLWQCAEGHIWEAIYSSIKSGAGCPYCSNRVPKTESDYHSLAAERGFKWLGSEPINTTMKTLWQCAEGHIWETKYNHIKSGVGCPYCSGNAPKTESDYHSLAAERGFKWLGSEVINVDTKTLWQCTEGHIWEAIYSSIKSGSGCPYCSGHAPKTESDYHKLAAERGFKWLGSEPINTTMKTLWQCDKGHMWETTFSSISSGGTGCPYCHNHINGVPVSQPQIALAAKLAGHLNHPEGPYRIDIALPAFKIAIEYDGWYWHNDESKDILRALELIQTGWSVLRIKSGTLIPDDKELFAALRLLAHTQTNYTEIILDDWITGIANEGIGQI